MRKGVKREEKEEDAEGFGRRKERNGEERGRKQKQQKKGVMVCQRKKKNVRGK